MITIAFQPELRPALPPVFASKDYREFRAILIEMDRILVVSQIEHDFILRQIQNLEKRLAKKGRRLSARQAQRHFRTFRLALRNVLLFTHKEQDLHATLPGFVEEIAADKNKVFSMLMRRY